MVIASKEVYSHDLFLICSGSQLLMMIYFADITYSWYNKWQAWGAGHYLWMLNFAAIE